MASPERFLMCPPDLYEVDYVINPWMEGNIHKSSREMAIQQWRGLHQILQKRAEVEQIAPQPGLPDMVFTANAGVAVGRRCVLSRFLYRERQGEEEHFKHWFKKHGFEVFELPADLPFEGAGDALLDRAGACLWAGYGFRSELDSHPYLARWLDIEVLSLRLIDPRFYHLDTCFCPLEGGWLIYYPQAFDAYSNRLIEQRVPANKRIAIGEADAVRFACNAVNIGRNIVVNETSAELQERLASAGFQAIQTPLNEFIKSGGAAKCLTLRLTEPEPPRTKSATTVQSRELNLEGHLLDSGLLDRALELTVQSGGSFQILHFNLGKQRQSTSKAEIKISGPSEEILDKIMGQMIELGAVVPGREEVDAELKPVTRMGVAPDDFFATTIYPTEVRVGGHWWRVQDQRMDGVIVVDEKQKLARCTLFRYLRAGEQVVTGSRGVRTIRKTESRDVRGSAQAEHEFSFMGAGVSSERRVELLVDQIAWEMHRIREQRGKIIVVPGPVVVHTGGAEHLAWLVREGYVQALLGGNAIAVHDIEQALLGTSLGVDLKLGTSVEGGHRHHLKAINIIRGCGGIAPAVEQGVLTSGIFFECARVGVPFLLAGSIRDDGPLPETQMDLITAQEEYSRLLKGADLILMLSSMLHSIGVGNMTPSGVRLVCVDINPAVVTKLSDRGSIESVGVVTDVGLFLNLLVQRLRKFETERQAV
ncbi:MAG TPA: TIGR00300 family protein [Candidatus Limnocylindrales bacterium]|jgi:lysine-ketoglutarate reductase/saccharopine dehydrogenase-like protein (TIGR00300 family)|nr:TIGR00300 family protein [Candidatus Limnocylindrales bacterium]